MDAARLGENHALVGLRAVGSFLVVVHHFFAPRPGAQGPGITFLLAELHGVLGIFFALSGFLMTYLYYDRFAKKTVTTSEFWLRRAGKIYPVYLVILMLVVVYYLSVSFSSWSAADTTDAFLHALGIHALFSQHIFSLVPTSWSLTPELAFYLIFPLVLFLVRRTGEGEKFRWPRVLLLFLLLNVGLLVAGRFAANWLPHWHGFAFSTSFMIRFTLAGRFLDFSSGMLVALWMLKSDQPRRLLSATPANLVGAVAIGGWLVVAYVMNALGGGPSPWGIRMHFLFAALASVFIFSLYGDSIFRKILSAPWIVALGKVSYPMYLLHLVTPLPQMAIWLKGSFPAFPFLGVLLFYAILLVPSAALYRLVEEPGKNLFRDLAARLFHKRSPRLPL